MSELTSPLKLVADGRFARFERIEWWDQALLADARVLVVGAGALGNEVVKNLCLLGVGNLIVTDMDRIELSNLSRSVLFRAADEGRLKAECAVEAARSIYPEVRAKSLNGNVLVDLGLGYVAWADVVVGALDNREARLWVNRACAMLGRPWIDGGIEVLNGIVRGFAPPRTSCYECTMNETDWNIVNQRRSCSLLARRALAHGGTPTTPTTASVIGALQAQEVVKLLHGREALLGRGFVFDGGGYDCYGVQFPINSECPWHGEAYEVHAAEELHSQSTLREVWQRAEALLGSLDSLELGRELVESVTCPACSFSRRVLAPAEKVSEDDVRCGQCGTECVPNFVHGVEADSPLLDEKLRNLCVPAWDILWARRGVRYIGLELAGDRPTDIATHPRDASRRPRTGILAT